MKHLDAITKKVTKHIDAFKFYQAADDLYHYVWHEFADKVIEQQKARLADQKTQHEAQALLLRMLVDILRLLHPFMPYVTEAIWTEMPIKNKKMLIVEEWPR